MYRQKKSNTESNTEATNHKGTDDVQRLDADVVNFYSSAQIITQRGGTGGRWGRISSEASRLTDDKRVITNNRV